MKLYTFELDGPYASGMVLVAAKTPEQAKALALTCSAVIHGYLRVLGEGTHVGSTAGRARVVGNWSYIE